MNAETGKIIYNREHLRQSIFTILRTPIGSRVMRREFGSLLPFMLDKPITHSTFIEIYAATADALAKHEPRLELQRVSIDSIEESRFSISIVGIFEGEAIELNGIGIG